jgi:hypothetical protein
VVSARRAIAEDKQRPQKSIIGWLGQNLLSRTNLWFERHFKALVLAEFAVVSTLQFAIASVVGLVRISDSKLNNNT